jgi:predicted DNA-binding transcriptional regulator AlpA
MQIQRRLKSREAAKYLGISYSKLTKLRTFGGGPKYFKLDHSVVYDTSDLDRYLAERARNNTSQDYAA